MRSKTAKKHCKNWYSYFSFISLPLRSPYRYELSEKHKIKLQWPYSKHYSVRVLAIKYVVLAAHIRLRYIHPLHKVTQYFEKGCILKNEIIRDSMRHTKCLASACRRHSYSNEISTSLIVENRTHVQTNIYLSIMQNDYRKLNLHL